MNCKICNGKTKPIFDKQFKDTYFYCEHCHFAFIEESHFPTFDEERTVYERHQNSLADEGYVKYLENFIDEGVNSFVKEGKGLDFGSGPEPVLRTLLNNRGFDVDLYDLHYANHQEVWEKTYDFITSTEVIEHFQNPLETLKAMVTLLKQGGYLSVMTLYLPEDLDQFQNWWYRRDVTHIAFYSSKTFKVIGEMLGLEVIYDNGSRICVFRKK